MNRVIRPVIEQCEVCGRRLVHHETADHLFERDSEQLAWRGWHAFRRGLATNLHDLGVPDLTIQLILRHSDVSVTQRSYIKRLPKQSVAAMKQLEAIVVQAGFTGLLPEAV